MRVLLVPNTMNESALAATVELAAWMPARGAEPVMTSSDADAAGLSGLGVPADDLGELALAVALGGDGTLLKAVHVLGDHEVGLLGVKYGRLGFLAGARPDTMREAILSALSGEARIERRTTLQAEVIMAGRTVGSYRALNEVVVSRGDSGRVIEVELSIDGQRLFNERADGIVVSTATGSTAYALSAGGPIVSSGHSGMVIVPVAPHTLRSRALLTGPSDVVEIALTDPTRADANVIVDGDVLPARRSLDRVVIRRGAHDVALVKHDGRDFYETLAEEFFGG